MRVRKRKRSYQRNPELRVLRMSAIEKLLSSWVFGVGVGSGGGVVVHGREEQEIYSISCPVHLFSPLYPAGPWLVVPDPGNITKGALLHLCPTAQLSPEVCLTIDRKLHDKQAE